MVRVDLVLVYIFGKSWCYLCIGLVGSVICGCQLVRVCFVFVGYCVVLGFQYAFGIKKIPYTLVWVSVNFDLFEWFDQFDYTPLISILQSYFGAGSITKVVQALRAFQPGITCMGCHVNTML